MIAKKHLKRLIAQVIALVAVLVVLGALALAGRIALYSLSGAKTSQALNEVPEVPEDAQDHVTWLPDRWDGARALEPGTRRQVEAAYVQVWEALGRYPETGDRRQVEQWFAGPARQRVLDMKPTLRREIWGVHFQLALTFYSPDGTTLAVRDEGATVVRSLQTDHGETLVTSTETYDSVLTLEDGYWRVRQLRQVGSEPLVEVSSTATTADQAAPTGARAQTLLNQGGSETVRAPLPLPVPRALTTADLPIDWVAPVAAGTDGTPAVPASYDRPQLESDLTAATAAGLNSVRITVPATAFGAVPTETGLAVVRSVLDRAQAHNLTVEVTIDSAPTDREPRTWTQADHRLEAVVTALADHPALILWNLYADPELAPTPDVQMRAWLVRAALKMQTLGTRIPVTIGWHTPGAAADPAMIDLVDLVTVPWRDRPERLGDWLSTITRTAGDRPLRLAPTAHSWNSIWPGGRTEVEQASWTAAVIRAATAYQVSNLLTGPLRDGSVPAPSLVPWVAGPATHSGLLRADGTPKLVAGAISPTAAAGWQAPGRYESLNKPFWRLSVILVLLTVPGLRQLVWSWLRRLRRGRDGPPDDLIDLRDPPAPVPGPSAPVASAPVASTSSSPLPTLLPSRDRGAHVSTQPSVHNPATPLRLLPIQRPAEQPGADQPPFHTLVHPTQAAQAAKAAAPAQVQAPAYATPTYDVPLYELPVQPPPAPTLPVAEGPAAEGPVAEGPAAERPVAEGPAAEESRQSPTLHQDLPMLHQELEVHPILVDQLRQRPTLRWRLGWLLGQAIGRLTRP